MWWSWLALTPSDQNFFFDKREAYTRPETELQQRAEKQPCYKQSRWTKFRTTGGDTPLQTWLMLLHFAKWANSCATLLKSLFRCRTCQLRNSSSKPEISWTIWPRPPLKSFTKIQWTTKRESDSTMTWCRSNSLASIIPASIANATVSSTKKQLGRTLQRAAAISPLKSLMTTPILDRLPSSAVAPSVFILKTPAWGFF